MQRQEVFKLCRFPGWSEKHTPLFLSMTPTHRLGCLGLIELIVAHSGGAFLAVVCPHPPLLVDPFIFLHAYTLEEDTDFGRIFRAELSSGSFKSGGGSELVIGRRLLFEVRVIGGC